MLCQMTRSAQGINDTWPWPRRLGQLLEILCAVDAPNLTQLPPRHKAGEARCFSRACNATPPDFCIKGSRVGFVSISPTPEIVERSSPSVAAGTLHLGNSRAQCSCLLQHWNSTKYGLKPGRRGAASCCFTSASKRRTCFGERGRTSGGQSKVDTAASERRKSRRRFELGLDKRPEEVSSGFTRGTPSTAWPAARGAEISGHAMLRLEQLRPCRLWHGDSPWRRELRKLPCLGQQTLVGPSRAQLRTFAEPKGLLPQPDPAAHGIFERP